MRVVFIISTSVFLLFSCKKEDKKNPISFSIRATLPAIGDGLKGVKYKVVETYYSSVFYRQSFHWSDYFTFSGRISVGTNVYSDWDQYKRYVWIGLGLEAGFGKKKCTK